MNFFLGAFCVVWLSYVINGWTWEMANLLAWYSVGFLFAWGVFKIHNDRFSYWLNEATLTKSQYESALNILQRIKKRPTIIRTYEDATGLQILMMWWAEIKFTIEVTPFGAVRYSEGIGKDLIHVGMGNSEFSMYCRFDGAWRNR